MLDAGVHFEELISKRELTDEERLLQYMAYIKYEQTTGGPARVQILYEHAIIEFPTSADIWLITEYLDRTLKGARMVKDILYRATWDCLRVKELWVPYLHILERLEEDLSARFRRRFACGKFLLFPLK